MFGNTEVWDREAVGFAARSHDLRRFRRPKRLYVSRNCPRIDIRQPFDA